MPCMLQEGKFLPAKLNRPLTCITVAEWADHRQRAECNIGEPAAAGVPAALHH